MTIHDLTRPPAGYHHIKWEATPPAALVPGMYIIGISPVGDHLEGRIDKAPQVNPTDQREWLINLRTNTPPRLVTLTTSRNVLVGTIYPV